MYGRTALLAALALCAAPGCTQRNALTDDRSPRRDVPIVHQVSGAYSRLARPIHVVIRDRATLARLPVTEIDVDFSRHMILLAGLGPTWQTGSGIRIIRVWTDGSNLHVEERQITGEPNQRSAPGRCSPWTMAVIPRSELNVEGYTARVPRGAITFE